MVDECTQYSSKRTDFNIQHGKKYLVKTKLWKLSHSKISQILLVIFKFKPNFTYIICHM
jgi:hypothetical protein